MREQLELFTEDKDKEKKIIMISLVGIRFGFWIVLEEVEKPKHLNNKDTYWLCKCNCGIEKIVKGLSLSSGRSKSCGCSRRNIPDFLNKKFEQLTIVGAGFFDKNVIFFPCLCDCGKETKIRYHDLVREDGFAIKSCGHNKVHSIPEEPRLSSARAVYRGVYSDGNLSFDDFLILSQLPCHYCGSEPSNMANSFRNKTYGCSDFAKEHGDFIYNGLDRKANNMLHNIENVVPCCSPCNRAKRDMSYSQFIWMITKIFHHRVEMIYKSK